MRNMKMALVVLALLAVASTSFAGFEITVTKQADPYPGYGYESYMVKVGGGADSFNDINIAGTVVQSNKFEETFLDPPAAPWAPIGTIWGPPAMPPLAKAMDTHFMVAKPTVGVGVDGAGVETNNAYANPDAPTSIIPVASSYYTGLGTFTSTKGALFVVRPAPAISANFLQVVIPAGTQVMLTGTWSSTTETGGIQQAIGVPEPGTIALLIGGLLCLVVVRFRK
jgi:hypothetical protein